MHSNLSREEMGRQMREERARNRSVERAHRAEEMALPSVGRRIWDWIEAHMNEEVEFKDVNGTHHGFLYAFNNHERELIARRELGL